MSGKGTVGRRARHWATLCFGLAAATACFASHPASAGDCPGNPDALGTSRTLVVDPREHQRIGTMQYAETLPLQDHEVVLTFDDGPIPRHSDQILAILAAQCVKATFFVVGRMAQEHPQGVRKLRDAGHTIGTHSQNHPLSMNRMSIEQAKQEVDAGIASATAALGDDKALAPFFRIPGLLRATAVEDYLASQGIQTWSADFPADDWRHISSAQVYNLAMSRLEAKGKGILLLHDIQPRTVDALPHILQELRARGYRIVQVVPATPQRPATPTEPGQWRLHPITETVATSHWPKIPNFVFANAQMLPAPMLSESDMHDGRVVVPDRGRPRRLARGAVPLPEAAPWPRQWAQPAGAATDMPVPAREVFQIPESVHADITALTAMARHAEQTAPATPLEADALMRLNRLGGGGLQRRLALPSHPSEFTGQSRRADPTLQ
ncbi:MAG TPA: polysaccharide deacetylase family protein [Rhodopseudomonas sp.]|uniref:polysaccharide deacetylase family protein n=1 Tax=Rhodopseudomonas sp. TaxID=1078 RepID=UPI002ED77B69